MVKSLPSSYELYLYPPLFYLGGAKIGKDGEMHSSPPFLGKSTRKVDTSPHRNHINISRGAVQQEVSHITSHHISLHTEFVGSFTY